LQPGERLSGPADWHDIHRASLHHLICTAIQYYISQHHTRVQDIRHLLTELELNSQFGDISNFAEYGSTGIAPTTEPASSADSTHLDDFPLPEDRPAGVCPLPTSSPQIAHGPPGLFLINLAVLAATTKLRIDPWNETTGYIQFIALHHWHPSFGIDFPTFLLLVHTELNENRLQTSTIDQNPFDLQVGPPSDQPASPFEEDV
jgi:hypothetical protein